MVAQATIRSYVVRRRQEADHEPDHAFAFGVRLERADRHAAVPL
jgi:hypothetical protein